MCRNNGAMNEISFRFLCKIAFLARKNGHILNPFDLDRGWIESRSVFFLAHQTFQTRWKFLDRIELFSNSSEETTKTLLAYFHLRQSPPKKKLSLAPLRRLPRHKHSLRIDAVFIWFSRTPSAPDFLFFLFLLFLKSSRAPRNTPLVTGDLCPHSVGSFFSLGKGRTFCQIVPSLTSRTRHPSTKIQRFRQKPSKVFPRTFRSQSPALTSFLYTVLSVGSWTFFRHPRRVGLNWNPKNIYRRRLRRRYFLPHLRPVLISNCEPIRLK